MTDASLLQEPSALIEEIPSVTAVAAVTQRLLMLESQQDRMAQQLDRIETLLTKALAAHGSDGSGGGAAGMGGKGMQRGGATQMSFANLGHSRDTTGSSVFTPRPAGGHTAGRGVPVFGDFAHLKSGRFHGQAAKHPIPDAADSGEQSPPAENLVDGRAPSFVGGSSKARRKSRVGFAAFESPVGPMQSAGTSFEGGREKPSPTVPSPSTTHDAPEWTPPTDALANGKPAPADMASLDTSNAPASRRESHSDCLITVAPGIQASFESSEKDMSINGGTASPGKRVRRSHRRSSADETWLARWGAFLPPTVDSSHHVVYASDAAYILLSFAGCCLAVMSCADHIGFDHDQPVPPAMTAWVVIFGMLSIAWMIVRGCFVRRRISDDEIADSHTKIASQYVRSWLALDAFVSVPFELLFIAWLNPAFYFLQAKHFVRLWRMQSLMSSSNPLLPGRPALVFVALAGACILLVFVIAAIFAAVDRGTTFVTALYWAMATLTSTGYGDVPTTADSTRGFAVFAMCASAMLVSLTQAVSTSLLTSRDVIKEDITKKKQTMYFMLNHYGVPWSVQKDVVFTFPAILESQREHLFKEMIQDLPPHVTAKLEFYVKMRVVADTAYFSSLLQALPSSADTIARAVADALSVRKVNTMEYLVQMSQPCVELLIVQSGVAEVVRETEDGEEVVQTLRRGATLGTIAVHTRDNLAWTVAAQALQPCDVYCLHRKDFALIAEAFPVLRDFHGDDSTRMERDWTEDLTLSIGDLQGATSMVLSDGLQSFVVRRGRAQSVSISRSTFGQHGRNVVSESGSEDEPASTVADANPLVPMQ